MPPVPPLHGRHSGALVDRGLDGLRVALQAPALDPDPAFRAALRHRLLAVAVVTLAPAAPGGPAGVRRAAVARPIAGLILLLDR